MLQPGIDLSLRYAIEINNYIFLQLFEGDSMLKLGKCARFALTLVLLVCLVPITAFGADAPDNLPNAIGKVVYLSGSVMAEQPDGTKRKLDLDKQVVPKDVVVTGSRSSVEIVFNDEAVFSQGPNARISLDEFVYTGNPSASKLLFKMGEGTFRYVTGKIVKQNSDAFALETPTTTIGIRGTEVFATITKALERIGNLELTAGHTMNVGPQQITRSMQAVSVDPATGDISPPGPVSAEEAAEVIKAAPQTTQGEPGAKNEDTDDMSRKVDAFKNNITRTKENLGTGKPDYGDLHTLAMQEQGQKTAKRDSDNAEAAQAASEGGGGY